MKALVADEKDFQLESVSPEHKGGQCSSKSHSSTNPAPMTKFKPCWSDSYYVKEIFSGRVVKTMDINECEFLLLTKLE